jgi:hypothetical protein
LGLLHLEVVTTLRFPQAPGLEAGVQRFQPVVLGDPALPGHLRGDELADEFAWNRRATAELELLA